jgi:hypothetical protein
MACGCCQGRCQANFAHISLSRPDSGLALSHFRVKTTNFYRCSLLARKGVRGCGDVVGPAARSGKSVRQSLVPPSLAQPSPPKWSRLIGFITHSRGTNLGVDYNYLYRDVIPSRNPWCNPANLKQSYHARVTCAILKSRSAEIRPSLTARLALLTGEIARDFPQFRTCLPGNIS